MAISQKSGICGPGRTFSKRFPRVKKRDHPGRRPQAKSPAATGSFSFSQPAATGAASSSQPAATGAASRAELGAEEEALLEESRPKPKVKVGQRSRSARLRKQLLKAMAQRIRQVQQIVLPQTLEEIRQAILQGDRHSTRGKKRRGKKNRGTGHKQGEWREDREGGGETTTSQAWNWWGSQSWSEGHVSQSSDWRGGSWSSRSNWSWGKYDSKGSDQNHPYAHPELMVMRAAAATIALAGLRGVLRLTEQAVESVLALIQVIEVNTVEVVEQAQMTLTDLVRRSVLIGFILLWGWIGVKWGKWNKSRDRGLVDDQEQFTTPQSSPEKERESKRRQGSPLKPPSTAPGQCKQSSRTAGCNAAF
eukprot:s7_g89.t1